MRSAVRRSLVAGLVTCCAAVPLAACGSSGAGDGSDGKVTITIDCEPPTSNAAQRKAWESDVAEFEKAHPDIDIKGIDRSPCEKPAAFTAQLRGGTESDLFYAYLTDTRQVVNSGQAADISKYVSPKTVPHLADINKDVLNIGKRHGKLYALPRTNYTMGLVYNTKLFAKAGLDPKDPPTTWAEVRTDAKRIAQQVGNGVAGYADYSAKNTGGWHFTAELYSRGGQFVGDGGKKATFNNAKGRAVLHTLHQMRWVDDSMGQKQNLAYSDLLKMAAAGKVGMYIGAADTIQAIHDKYQGKFSDWAMAPMPGAGGPAAATLAGGDQYFFKKGLSPAQIKAGIKWLNFEFLTPGKGQLNYARAAKLGDTVGLPKLHLFGGATHDKVAQQKKAHATVPVENYTSFVSSSIPGKPEPPHAQECYKVLDKAMSAVLTNQYSDIGQLLTTAENGVNQVLATG